jgi:extracellular factor (EF) 3-hydroxypalmitic acid methyl ester biosynthesis protein
METNILVKNSVVHSIDQVQRLIDNGISSSDFKMLDKLILSLSAAVNNGEITKSELSEISRSFGEEFLNNTVQGYGLLKPHGYAGDYMMIDKIYTYHKSDIDKYRIWAEYFHQSSAPIAVRNRKEYFKAKMKHKLKSATSTLELLNVASGPARDLLELYQGIEDPNALKTTCIEIDQNAISYASNLIKDYSNHIEFVKANVLRYRTEDKYDVIWSAGLFDYFNDKAFVMVLSRFKEMLKPGGEIIIGNFNENNNPSREYMEIFGEWFLIHRTEEQLASLAMDSGFNFTQINIGREKENVNLFMHIKS